MKKTEVSAVIEEIEIKSNKKSELIDITDAVQGIVEKSGVKEGMCVVYCPHTTTAIIVSEGADPNVQTDILNALNRLVPASITYAHREGNSDAHIKSALIGNSRTILIKDGKLVLGTWEACFFCEFDGSKSRKAIVLVK